MQQLWVIAGGAVSGYGFSSLRQTKVKFRVWMGLLMAVGLAAAAMTTLREHPEWLPKEQRLMAGVLLLLGLPLFYLLTLCGLAEESEIEFAALCTGLCIGLWLVSEQMLASSQGSDVAVGLPIILYFVYTMRIMPGLRVSNTYCAASVSPTSAVGGRP